MRKSDFAINFIKRTYYTIRVRHDQGDILMPEKELSIEHLQEALASLQDEILAIQKRIEDLKRQQLKTSGEIAATRGLETKKEKELLELEQEEERKKRKLEQTQLQIADLEERRTEVKKIKDELEGVD